MTTFLPSGPGQPVPTLIAYVTRLTSGKRGRFRVEVRQDGQYLSAYEHITFQYPKRYRLPGIWPNHLVIVGDGTSGNGHTPYANIDATGTVRGMKETGRWDRDAVTVRRAGFIFNLSALVVSDELDLLSQRLAEQGRDFEHLAVNQTGEITLRQPLTKN